MLTRIKSVPLSLTLGAMVCLSACTALAQNSTADFHKILRERADFKAIDFAALEEGQAIVRLLPQQDKREVAVCGLVRVQGPAELFLQSFRESMTRKSNPAILEIGSFSHAPTLADLQTLSIEDRDIEDLKQCVVGDCKLKLSAMMIERFRNEVSWEAPDSHSQATQLFKRMLVDYVRDYRGRGDVALIEYSDQRKDVRLAEEHRALMAAPSYLSEVLAGLPSHLKDFPGQEQSIVENAIVWSKVKFGLKPVIAINHITIHKREQETGPRILIVSKQIYANHYFDSSLALTGFVTVPGSSPRSYLVYENRSRADGLEGPFRKIKRGIVEHKAIDALQAILERSKANLDARALDPSESAAASLNSKRGWKQWKVGGVHLFLWLFLFTALAALFTLGTYDWRRVIGKRAL